MGAMALADEQMRDAEAQRTVAAAFDADFYRDVYDDLPSTMGAFRHYWIAGWTEHRDPAAWFSASGYLEDYPEVAAAGDDPFLHFLTHGAAEGRQARPSRHAARYLGRRDWSPPPMPKDACLVAGLAGRQPVFRPLSEGERAAVTAEFDAAYYLAVNPDIAAVGVDPLEHFIVTGWLEGRDPNARFSVRDYLEANPDVAATGVHPFAHYLVAGRAEGRAARHDLGFRYDVIARLQPVEARVATAVAASRAVRIEAAGVLAAALAGVRNLHITLSHDDYVAHFGGLQSCVRREAAAVGAQGLDHLHLHPAVSWPTVRAAGEPGPMGVLLNGRRIGTFAPETVRQALGALLPGRRSVAIHSLLGHEPEATLAILQAAGVTDGFFWLHDFASLCAGVHLLRNDVQDCAAPAPDSAACGVCAYGPLRVRHLDAHRRLFEALSLTVVAPAATTLAFWEAHTDLPARRTVVLPHATLRVRGPAPPSAAGPMRIAYLGMPTPLKGWPVFRALAQAFEDDPRYAFLHLGGRPDPSAPATFHRVIVSEAQPLAMQEALEAMAVDAALVWPLCRETFSFTAYEAAAAGAAVLTGPDSGNVAVFAADPAIGGVLDDESALMEAFATGDILALSRPNRRPPLHDLVYSDMTGDLIREATR